MHQYIHKDDINTFTSMYVIMYINMQIHQRIHQDVHKDDINTLIHPCILLYDQYTNAPTLKSRST